MIHVSPGQTAIERTIALVTDRMKGPTWQKEEAIALSLYAACRADPNVDERRLELIVAVIRDQHPAAKRGDGDAANAILDACDELRNTAAAILPHTWMPAYSDGRPPTALLDLVLNTR